MGPPLAVLDVGSNTIRLLAAENQNGHLHQLLDHSEFVRLGLGVDRTGRLDPQRIDAALQAIEMLKQEARALGVETILAIATSAVRDAQNGQEFAARVQHEMGIPLEIISGEREAYLTYLGATLDLSLHGGAIIADLGGGSAELIAAGDNGVDWDTSLKIGSGRLTERFVQHDPPEPAELAAVRAYVTSLLDDLPRYQASVAIYTGGTATHVARVAGSDGEIAGLTPERLHQAVDLIDALPAQEMVDRYRFRPERAAVLPAGATSLAAIAGYYQVESITITRHGLREGALVDYLRQQPAG